MTPRSLVYLVLFLAAEICYGRMSTVAAQGNPSADAIINSLGPCVEPPNPWPRPKGGGAGGNCDLPGGTRGIRLAPSPNDPSAQQPHVASNKPVPSAAASVNLMVNFANGSAKLTPDAIRTWMSWAARSPARTWRRTGSASRATPTRSDRAATTLPCPSIVPRRWWTMSRRSSASIRVVSKRSAWERAGCWSPLRRRRRSRAIAAHR